MIIVEVEIYSNGDDASFQFKIVNRSTAHGLQQLKTLAMTNSLLACNTNLRGSLMIGTFS